MSKSRHKTSSPWAVTLGWQHSYICYMTYKPSKLGQIDLVLHLWSEFIGRSVHAGLQVGVFTSHDLYYLVNGRTCRQLLAS